MASTILTDADFADEPQAVLSDADFADSSSYLTDADFAPAEVSSAVQPIQSALLDVGRRLTGDPMATGLAAGRALPHIRADEAADARMRGRFDAAQQEIQEAQSSGYVQPISDIARRVPAAIGGAALDAAAGVAKAAGDAGLSPERMLPGVGPVLAQLGAPTAMDAASGLAREASAGAAKAYGVDPRFDRTPLSELTTAAASLVPAVASGPLAPVTMAGMMGEQGRREAVEAGGTAGQQERAFYGNAAVGALSEFAMGIPALVRAVKATGVPAATAGAFARAMGWQAVKSAGREATQEVMENTASNFVANTVAGYDPERGTMDGFLKAAAYGALIGAPVGAVAQGAQSYDSAKEIERLTAQASTRALQDTASDPEAMKALPYDPSYVTNELARRGAEPPPLAAELARTAAVAPATAAAVAPTIARTQPVVAPDPGSLTPFTDAVVMSQPVSGRLGPPIPAEPGTQIPGFMRRPVAEPTTESAPIGSESVVPPDASTPDTPAPEASTKPAKADTSGESLPIQSANVASAAGSQEVPSATPATAPEAAAGAAPVPSERAVAPHLRPAPSTQSILDEQPASPEVPSMLRAGAPPEGGAAGGAGGRRPSAPAAVGVTPRGDKKWLRIPKWWRRLGRGLFTEGARGVLARTNNQVGRELGKATRRHVDLEQELFGQHDRVLADAVNAVPPKRRDAMFAEIEQFVRDTENGRPSPPLPPDAQAVLDAWHEVGRSTGDIARANNVMVFDAARGGYRPMGTVANYVPRMFRGKVEQVLRDPQKDPAMFNSLAQAIATHRGITEESAAAELRGVAGRFQSNDFMGNMEIARSEALPEIFYDYDIRNLASRYLPAFSERMAQIIAYGQRLGPREKPLRMNLWDIARRESEDGETQQWLNAAEDQATDFKAKSSMQRNARRMQAIGNALLLSDPTSSTVRNLLGGLSVTSERYGVGRSIRQLLGAMKTANQMDAKQIGAVRDDIGAFLGADQMGDSWLDKTIRSVQSGALKASGFSGAETLVRTHGALTASAFARDAVASLQSDPSSALSREALALFQRMDIDPEAVVAEGGDWRSGPETRKFIRTSLRDSQGGYRFDQVPLWANSTAGRFFYQYGRWALQRGGDIFKNTIRPALGEQVEFRGKKMTRRNVMPLLRLGMASVGLGEAFALIASALFDRDRKDESLNEIAAALSDGEMKALGMLGDRMLNDIVMSGTFGIIGQPFDLLKSAKDQSRLKNPLAPPSLVPVQTVVALSRRIADQGTLTNRDLLSAASSVVRGPKNITDVARNIAGEKLYEAQNDQRTLRNAAFRWAKSQGMDVSMKTGFGDARKSPNAPVYEAMNDALLSGNAEEAKAIAKKFAADSEDSQKAEAALASSVEGKAPFRAGNFTSEKHRKAFMEWAVRNLSADDYRQIDRVQRTYQDTARAAGFSP